MGGGPDTFSKPLGVLVVLWQHLLCLGQSHQGSRRQHSGLAHASTQGFAEAPGFLDEVPGSPNQSSHRRAEALRGERRDSWGLFPQPVLEVGCACARCGLHGPGLARSGGLWEAQNSGVQLYPQCEGQPTLERQKDTESQCSTRRAGGTRRATAAFISRAPSRWTRAPWVWARRRTWGQRSGKGQAAVKEGPG